jgi:hypothetical protein
VDTNGALAYMASGGAREMWGQKTVVGSMTMLLSYGNNSPENGPDPLNYLYLQDETIASQPTL